VSSCPGTLTVQVEDCQVEMCVCSRIGCFVWWKKHCGVRQVSTHYSTRLSCLTLGESLYFFKSQVYNCKKGRRAWYITCTFFHPPPVVLESFELLVFNVPLLTFVGVGWWSFH
jgi:hypothetical protein